MIDDSYDVFLSYNSSDAAAALELAKVLRDAYGLRVWIDRWKLSPGDSWIDCLQGAIAKSKCLLSCVGSAGQGPWHQKETNLGLQKQASDSDFKLIPVLLPGAPKPPNLPNFLSTYTWSDLTEGFSDRSEVRRLVEAINTKKDGVNDEATPMAAVSGLGRQIVSLQRSTRKQYLPAPFIHRLSAHLHRGSDTYVALVRDHARGRAEIHLSPFEPQLWRDLRVVEYYHSGSQDYGLLEAAGLVILIRERISALNGLALIRYLVGPGQVGGASDMDSFLSTQDMQHSALFTDPPNVIAQERRTVGENSVGVSARLWETMENHCPQLLETSPRFVVFSEPLRFMIRYVPADARVKRVMVRFSGRPGALRQIELALGLIGIDQIAGIGVASVFGPELDLICNIPENLSEETTLKSALLKEIPDFLNPQVRILTR